MRASTVVLAFSSVALFAGCVAVPYYAPAPVARLTPEQSAALAARPIAPGERERIARLNADVQREQDAADAEQQRNAVLAQSYGYGAYPAYGAYPGYGGYYAYPGYYPGFYPYWPGVSLSFGYIFRGGWGHRGWGHGRWGGRGGWHR